MAVDTATNALVLDEYCSSCDEVTAHDRVESVRNGTNGLRWFVAFCQECNADGHPLPVDHRYHTGQATCSEGKR